jgi:predicted solute-binding protein
MSRTNLEAMFDNVEWEKVKIELTDEQKANSPLYATHQGVLQVGDKTIRVYQLNNGSRILDKEDADKFFEMDLSAFSKPVMLYRKD